MSLIDKARSVRSDEDEYSKFVDKCARTLERVGKLIGSIKQNQNDLFQLSSDVMELAATLEMQADITPLARFISRGLEMEYKAAREKHKMDLVDGLIGPKTSASYADSSKVAKTTHLYEKYNEAEYLSERLNYAWSASKEAISTGRSKLSYLKNAEGG